VILTHKLDPRKKGQLEVYLNLLGLANDNVQLPIQVFGIDFNGIIYLIKITGKPSPSFKLEFYDDCLIGYQRKEAYLQFERLATPDPGKLTLEQVLNLTRNWENNPSLICCFPPFKFKEIFEGFDRMKKPIPLIRLSKASYSLFDKEVHEIINILKGMLVKIPETENPFSTTNKFTVYRTYKTTAEYSDDKPRLVVSR